MALSEKDEKEILMDAIEIFLDRYEGDLKDDKHVFFIRELRRILRGEPTEGVSDVQYPPDGDDLLPY